MCPPRKLLPAQKENPRNSTIPVAVNTLARLKPRLEAGCRNQSYPTGTSDGNSSSPVYPRSNACLSGRSEGPHKVGALSTENGRSDETRIAESYFPARCEPSDCTGSQLFPDLEGSKSTEKPRLPFFWKTKIGSPRELRTILDAIRFVFFDENPAGKSAIQAPSTISTPSMLTENQKYRLCV